LDTERALAERLVKGVLESKTALDAELDTLLSKGLSSLPPPVRHVLRLGLYQVRGLDRIPKEVAVSETVNLSKQVTTPGLTKVVNAVLRRATAQGPAASTMEITPEGIAARHSHPPWLVERWCKQLGSTEAEALCAYNNLVWPITVRVNTLVASIDEARERAQSVGLQLEPGSVLPECFVVTGLPLGKKVHELDLFTEGIITIQDESACIAAHLVSPAAEETVVDLCAAPGGKTTHLAALMKNSGRVIAVDPSEMRLEMVRENCQRLQVKNVEYFRGDGLSLVLPHQVDKVLVDAPCSGLGTLGRKKDVRWKKQPGDLTQLHHLQVDLLSHAAQLVRLG
jgi:16S rRNA (cytosine967-C5)-methyltransferase